MKTLNSKLIFLGLQVLDLLTTLACFHFGFIEVSPFTAHMITFFGLLTGLIITKALACAAIVPIKKLVWVGNIVYIAVVGWNFFLSGLFVLASLVKVLHP